MKSLCQFSGQAKCRICHKSLDSFADSSDHLNSDHLLCTNCQINQEASANLNLGSVSLAKNSGEELMDDEYAGGIKKKLDEIRDEANQNLKRLGFEIEVFHQEENNKIDKKDVSAVLHQLKEFEMSREFLEAYEKAEEFSSEILEKNEDYGVFQRSIQGNLRKIKDGFEKALELLNLKPLSFEFMTEISRLYGPKAKEVIFLMIMKTVNTLRLKEDDEELLNVSQEKPFREINYDEIKDVEKIDLKIENIESTETIVFSLSFLLENCLKNISSLKLSFGGRYISNQEAERFSNCAVFWKRIKYLTMDFTRCTFEDEETPLIFFKGGRMGLENLNGFSCFLGDSNATQNTVNSLNQLIRSQIPMLECFGMDLSNLLVRKLMTFSTGLLKLDINLRNAALSDDEITFFSERTLPEMRNLNELRLCMNRTQVTNKGLIKFFKSIQENCASQLKTFELGIGENNVTDESFEKFSGDVVPLLKNLEKFRLFIHKTLITDNTLFPLCKNIKHFASGLRIFALDVSETAAATDKVINALALVSIPLMKKLEIFTIRFSKAKMTDQSLYNFYSSMAASGLFSALKEFKLDCSKTDITDQSFAIFANKVLPKMTKLKKFTFHANKTKLGDPSLKILFKNLCVAKFQLQVIDISLDETEIGKQSILALACEISSLTSLTHLSLEFKQAKLEDSSINRLCASFKVMARNLESLRLGLNSTRVTDRGIFPLGNEIAPEMISLKELKLGLSRTGVGDTSLKLLFENLEGTAERLQELQLCLNGTKITDQSLLALAAKSTMPSLKSFELLVENTDISDRSIVPLMHSLKNKLCDCHKLALAFRKTKISDEAIWAFSTYVLIHMKNLQDFQFSFGESQVSDPNLFWFFCNLIPKVERMKNFELEFGNTINDLQVQLFAYLVLPNFSQKLQTFRLSWHIPNIFSSTFRALCFQAHNAFKNINSFHLSSSSLSMTSSAQEGLKELHFELNETQITDFVMHEILQKFQGQVSQVKNFSFLVKGTQVTSGSVETLADMIFPFMSNLESLTINFDNIVLTDQDFCSLCKSMEGFAKNIKSFKINLGIWSLDNLSFVSLANFGLEKMVNLESLSLDFNSNKNIEQSLGILFTCLKGFVEKLKTFSLSVSGIKLPPEAIEALSNSIFPKFKSLMSFHLTLYETNINDSEFIILFSGLKDEILKNLRSFNLVIQEKALGDEALNVLSSKILPQLKNVEAFGCHFANNDNITNENFLKFSEKLKELSHQIDFK